MNWTEIKKAINSKLGTNDFKPFDEIINFNLKPRLEVVPKQQSFMPSSSDHTVLENAEITEKGIFSKFKLNLDAQCYVWIRASYKTRGISGNLTITAKCKDKTIGVLNMEVPPTSYLEASFLIQKTSLGDIIELYAEGNDFKITDASLAYTTQYVER